MASRTGDWLRKLKSSVAGVRSHAAWQLGRLRDVGAVSGLVRVLQSDEHEDARLTTAWALGELGDPAAIPALEAAHEHDEADDERPSDDVRSQAWEALRALRGETEEV